ncbi:MAG: radical SAM family heme chaperone HemW, partial [Lachnospiraceae bacterium]|nr:radical SAM family heme chaperone HemW [Lachnospiraceae bacterium]
KFFDCLYSNYKIDSNAEISMESNPGTLTKEKAKVYKDIGINRVSLGLQSTVDSELNILGRIHTYNEFLESFMILRDEGFENINVDLMNGIPEQTLKTFSNGLEKIKDLNPEHISIYSLILEEGTPFYGMNLKLPNEEEERLMVHSIPEILGSEYHQYEISNYSKKGFECKHNIKYWKRDEYLGFGLSAASFMSETRFKNTDDIKVYLDNSDNKNVYTEFDVLNKDEQMSEYMILGLRMNEGVNLSDFEKTFGKSVLDVYGDKIALHIKEELLERKDNRLFLTEKGRDLANYVWSDFLGD